MADDMNLGATGKYPNGKLGPNDQGELRAAMAVVDDKIVIDFGTPITWTAMTAEQALQFAGALTKKANEILSKHKS